VYCNKRQSIPFGVITPSCVCMPENVCSMLAAVCNICANNLKKSASPTHDSHSKVQKIAGIAGSNLAGGVGVRVFCCVLCFYYWY
jgi:hypothetical protein